MYIKKITAALGCLLCLACQMKEKKVTETEKNDLPAIGTIERMDPALDALVDQDAKIEIIAEGFEWSEGPLWIEDHKMLLFSDVPENTVHKWTADKGTEVYLTPSGFSGTGRYSQEPGSNGLTLNRDGKLVLCQHGDRKVAVMDAPFDKPEARFITVAAHYEGKRFNSPNDVVVRQNGDVFFTDPPYGLPNQADDATKEIPFQGVYKVSNGTVTLLTDSLTRPNGLVFLPGEKTLLVANSDPQKATWYAFDLDENDKPVNARIFFDATDRVASEKGLPDGMKADKNGNVYATGPGGVWIFNNTGKVLGKIRINDVPTSNCALAEDDKVLYITADMYVLRVRLRN